MEQSQLLFTLINDNKRKEFLESKPTLDKFNTIFKDNGLNDEYKNMFVRNTMENKELSYENIYQLVKCPEFIDRYLSISNTFLYTLNTFECINLPLYIYIYIYNKKKKTIFILLILI